MEESAEIGIFGGTGIYDSGLLKEPREISIDTPYCNRMDKRRIRIDEKKKCNCSSNCL